MIPTWRQTDVYQAVLGLFSAGDQGVFLDANDWGTSGTGGTGVVFQDLAGTPVTAMEQPVQLILDKSQGLKLGSELVTNGGFTTDLAGWTSSSTPPATSTWAAGGLALYTDGSAYAGEWQGVTTVVGKWYKTQIVVTTGGVSLQFRVGTSGGAGDVVASTNFMTAAGTYTFYFLAVGTTSYVQVRSGTNGTSVIRSISTKNIAGNHAYVPSSANRPIITARYNLLTQTAALSTQSVTVGAGSYTLYFTGSGSVALSGAATGTKTAGSNVITCTAGTLTLTVTGSVLTADLRPTDQTVTLPPYQWVTTGGAGGYDTAGFPPLIKGNGSNQYLTGNLDLSSTNKVSLWTGVRKTSDAAAAMLFETSANSTANNGAISLSAPATNAATNYVSYSKGTTGTSATATPFAAPLTNVVTVLDDISAPSNKIRINGVDKASDLTSQGTGNYGNYAYYILSRAGSSLFSSGGFNCIILVGKAASAAEGSAAEAYCNQKVRAY